MTTENPAVRDADTEDGSTEVEPEVEPESVGGSGSPAGGTATTRRSPHCRASSPD